MSGLGRKALLGSLTTTAGTMGGFLGRFAVNIVLARILTPVDFGEFALAMLQAEFLGLLGALSFPQALLQLEDDYADLPGTVFWMSLGLGIILFGIGLAAWPFVTAAHGPTVGSCFLWMAAARVISLVATTLLTLYQRRYRFHTAALVQFLSVIVASLATLGIALVEPSPFALVVREAGPSVFTVCVLGVLVVRSEGRAFFAFDRRSAVAVWRLSRAVFMTRVFEIIYNRVDQLILGLALGTRELGFYQQARYLIGLPQAAVAPIAGVVGLRALSSLRGDPRRQARAFELTQYAVVRVIMVFSVAAAVAGDLGTRIVLGPGWEPTGEVVMLFAPWLPLITLAGNYRVMLLAERRFAPIVWATVFAAGALCAAALPLTLWLGMAGLAAGNLVVVAAHLAIMVRATPDHLKLGRAVYAPTAVAALVAVGLGWAARVVVPGDAAWWSAAAIGLGVASVTFTAATLLVERHRLRAELRYVVGVMKRRGAD